MDGTTSGTVSVYSWNGNNWNQLGSSINGDTTNHGQSSVSLSQDGTRLAIGGRVIKMV